MQSLYLSSSDDLLALSSERVWVDADAFEAEAMTALARGDMEDIERALIAYRGELLPEDRYEEWTATRRATLADLHYELLLKLAAIYEQRGRLETAVEHLQYACELDPVREDLQQSLMQLYVRAGQRHRALRQYQICREAIRCELDCDVAPETEAIYQAILSGAIGADTALAESTADTPLLPLPAVVRRIAVGPLVGRDHELRRLVDAVSESPDSGGQAILVGGEAGLGKTRMAAELTRIVHGQGAAVLWGACYEEGSLPYGPFTEALDRAVGAYSQADRARLGAAYPELLALIPTLHRQAADQLPATPRESRPTRLFAAIVRFLDELAGDKTLLIVIDDLHLADTATLQVLHHLIRLAGERRWLLLGTFRDGDVKPGGPFQQFRATATRGGLIRDLDLERLSREECDQLISALVMDGHVTAAVRGHLFSRTLGNPLFLHELLRMMREEGKPLRGDSRWVSAQAESFRIPVQVHDLIDARVDRLGADVRQALGLAAAAGEMCSFQVLRATGELPDRRLLDALDQALDAQLLEPTDTGYAFRHPLVRATLYERLSPPRRASFHRALAQAIERLPVQTLDDQPELVEALARHWAAAGEATRAIPYLIEAADRAARVYANEDAVARLRRATALLDELPNDRDDVAKQRASILERLGDLHALLAESYAARDHYLEAATVLASAGARAMDIARQYRKAAQQVLASGHLKQAEALLQVAQCVTAETSDQDSAVERARLLTLHAHRLFLSYRFPQALEVGEEALRLAEEMGTDADVAQACELVAMACLPLGQWRRGMEFERRHAVLADSLQAMRDVADAHICFAEYHLWGEQPAEATRMFLRNLDESERAGAPRSLALCQYFLGTMAYVRGRFAEAIARLTEAIGLYQRVGSPFGEAIALYLRGLAQSAIGWHEQGRADLERGVELADQGTLRSHALVRVYAGFTRYYLERGDAGSARQFAELGLNLTEEPSTCICNVAIRPVATTAHALMGDLERAADLGKSALARAKEWGSPFFLCAAHQADATVRGMSGEWEAALSAASEARRIAQTHDFPYELARCLQLSAFLHEQRNSDGDLRRANGFADQAALILQHLHVPMITS
jgi:predicted ATPase